MTTNSMIQVLILTGTCGSGKSTVAKLIAAGYDWAHVSEDDIWSLHFHRRRGSVGSENHLKKRHVVRRELVRFVKEELSAGRRVVVDATVHEGTPQSYEEYGALLGSISWEIRVLHPRLDVAIARDAQREGWKAGANGVESLWRKFTQTILPQASFIDTSDERPAETAARVMRSLGLPT